MTMAALRYAFSRFLAAATLAVLSLPPVAHGLRPSDHGLAFQQNSTVGTPAMAAFFRGDGGGRGAAQLPEAGNATASDWRARVTPMSVGDGRGRLRTVLLAVGVACAAVGLALLAAAGVAYLNLDRRRRVDDAGAAAAGNRGGSWCPSGTRGGAA